MCSPRSFHPSKEGFKVDYGPENTNRGRGFHPSKEGFKVSALSIRRQPFQVSIPLRKVSRHRAPEKGR